MLLSDIKQIQRLWHRIGGGLLVPTGYSAHRSQSSSETYLDIKGKSLELNRLYTDAGVSIPKGSGIHVLIESAKDLSDAWLIGRADVLEPDVLWNATHLARVADACLALGGELRTKSGYLRRLTNGSLNLLSRDRSEAKDILWELELLRSLRAHRIEARLEEPPDIVATFEGVAMAIACKKLYSESNVEKILSNGVAQIESRCEYGIVAMNLDDLLPANVLLVKDDEEQALKALDDRNVAFLKRHERNFRKYLSTGRILSTFVSTAALADTQNGKVRLSNLRQSTAWMTPDLPTDKQKVYRSFYNAVLQ